MTTQTRKRRWRNFLDGIKQLPSSITHHLNDSKGSRNADHGAGGPRNSSASKGVHGNGKNEYGKDYSAQDGIRDEVGGDAGQLNGKESFKLAQGKAIFSPSSATSNDAGAFLGDSVDVKTQYQTPDEQDESTQSPSSPRDSSGLAKDAGLSEFPYRAEMRASRLKLDQKIPRFSQDKSLAVRNRVHGGEYRHKGWIFSCTMGKYLERGDFFQMPERDKVRWRLVLGRKGSKLVCYKETTRSKRGMCGLGEWLKSKYVRYRNKTKPKSGTLGGGEGPHPVLELSKGDPHPEAMLDISRGDCVDQFDWIRPISYKLAPESASRIFAKANEDGIFTDQDRKQEMVESRAEDVRLQEKSEQLRQLRHGSTYKYCAEHSTGAEPDISSTGPTSINYTTAQRGTSTFKSAVTDRTKSSQASSGQHEEQSAKAETPGQVKIHASQPATNAKKPSGGRSKTTVKPGVSAHIISASKRTGEPGDSAHSVLAAADLVASSRQSGITGQLNELATE